MRVIPQLLCQGLFTDPMTSQSGDADDLSDARGFALVM